MWLRFHSTLHHKPEHKRTLERAATFVIFLLVFSISNAVADASNQERFLEEEWLVTWGGSDYESPRRIIVDGDYIYLVGRTTSYGDGESNVFLLKYDLLGELQWESIWNNPLEDAAEDFTLDEDSIYITGKTVKYWNNDSYWDIFLLKYDKDGQLIWNTSWGGLARGDEPSFQEPNDVELLGDDVYVLGYTSNNSSQRSISPSSEQDILLLKYNSSGDLIWQRQYGGDLTFEYGYCLEIVDRELYVASRTLTIDLDNDLREEMLYLLKLDSDGDVLWNRTYDELSCDSIMYPSGMTIEDEHIYVVGEIPWNGSKTRRMFTSRFGLDGKLEWIHVLAEDHYYAKCGIAIVDDHLLVAAGNRTHRKNSDLAIFDYDLEGNLVGNFSWGTEKNESLKDMRVSADTIYLMGMISPSQELVDVYLAAVNNPYAVKESDSGPRFKIPGFSYVSITTGILIAGFLYYLGRRSIMS